jgi:hypothetical protein
MKAVQRNRPFPALSAKSFVFRSAVIATMRLSTLSLRVFRGCHLGPPSTTPGSSEPRCSSLATPTPNMGLCLRGQRLGSPKYPTIRFSQGFTSAAACQVARPLCGSDRGFPSPRDFYFQDSVESVALLGAGYNYDSHWIVQSMGLSPIGLTSSLAARPQNLMKIPQRRQARAHDVNCFDFSTLYFATEGFSSQCPKNWR